MSYAKLVLNKFEANKFVDPFLKNLQPFKTKDILIGLTIFIMAFAALGSLCTEALANGDAALYLQQMKNLNFTNRPVHIGYYVLGAGFIRILPGSDDRAINLMSSLLGALSIMIVYLITFAICHKHIPAVTASMLLLTHNIFLQDSIYAEVYTPQISFLLLSIFLWLLNKPILSSLSFILSFLISPSSVLALPFFFILRPRLRSFLLFCTIFLIIAAAVIFPVRHSYFFGGRGLFRIAHRPFDISWALAKEGREVFSGFFLCIPLILIGLFEIFSRRQLRPFAFALLIFWLVTLFLAEKIIDVSPQLPVYALLCVVGGLGLGLLLRFTNRKTHVRFAIYAAVIAVIVTIFINGIDSFQKAHELNKYHTDYRNTVLLINKVAEPDYLVIGYWSVGILFEHYIFQKSFTPLWINTEWLDGDWGPDRQLKSLKKLNQAIAAQKQIWLLGKYKYFMEKLQQNGYRITRFGSAKFDLSKVVIPIYVANAIK